MVCLLGRAEYVIDIEFAKYPTSTLFMQEQKRESPGGL